MTLPVDSDKSGLRVVVLSDIHGNIRALNAVLEEVVEVQPDRIVVCGDVVSGPFPGETLDRLMALGDRACFVRGNADREVLSAYDNRHQYDPDEGDPIKKLLSWNAGRIDRKQRDFLASFEDRVVLQVTGLGSVLFCHGSPRSDEEIITSLTPEGSLEKILAGVEGKVVVCGHTHHQFDRKAGEHRVINGGSIGMPYEVKPGAYWATLGPGVDLRRTEYDVARAVQDALATGYPDPSYQENLLTPPKPEVIAAFFEQVAAGRGERS